MQAGPENYRGILRQNIGRAQAQPSHLALFCCRCSCRCCCCCRWWWRLWRRCCNRCWWCCCGCCIQQISQYWCFWSLDVRLSRESCWATFRPKTTISSDNAPFRLSICPFHHLSICPVCSFLHLPIRMFVSLSLDLFVRLSLGMNVHFFVCPFILFLFVHLSVCSFACLSISVFSICPFVHLFKCLFAESFYLLPFCFSVCH